MRPTCPGCHLPTYLFAGTLRLAPDPSLRALTLADLEGHGGNHSEHLETPTGGGP